MDDRLANRFYLGNNISKYLTADMVTFVDVRESGRKEFIVHESLLKAKAGNWIQCEKPDLIEPVPIPDFVADAFEYFINWLYGGTLEHAMEELPFDTQFSYLLKLFDWGVSGSLWPFLNDVQDRIQDLIYYDKKAKFTEKHVNMVLNSAFGDDKAYFCGALVHWSILNHKGISESDLEKKPKIQELREGFQMFSPQHGLSWHPCRRTCKNEDVGFDPCQLHFHELDLEGLDPEDSWCKRTVSLKPSTRKELRRAPHPLEALGPW